MFSVVISDDNCPYTDNIVVTPSKGMLYAEVDFSMPEVNSSLVFPPFPVKVIEGNTQQIHYLYNGSFCGFNVIANKGEKFL